MGWDPVPWAVLGGYHSAETLRLLAHMAGNQNEGIFGPGDLKVRQYDVPGAGVLVATGAAVILNRATSMADQSYAGRMPTEDNVAVAATSGTARSDMVIARVEDPNMADQGYSPPPNPTQGPYIFTRLLPNVGSAAVATPKAARAYLASQNMNAIPLAGITRGASIGTVINSNITDLRAVANPRQQPDLLTVNPGAVYSVTGAWADWFGFWDVDVPAWASRVILSARLHGVRIDRLSTTQNGTAYGQVRVAIGTSFTQGAAYDADAIKETTTARLSLGAGENLVLPVAMRGTTQRIRIQGTKLSGTKNIYVDASSYAEVDVRFLEAAA